MGGSRRRGKQDAAEDVGGQLLLSFGLLEGLLPIGGGEFEQTLPGPAGQQTEQIAQVGERLDIVQAGAGQQGDEDSVHERSFVTANEKPVSAAQDLPAQIQLADVVRERQPAIIEESAESDALVARIPDRRGERRFIHHPVSFDVAPFEKPVHQRSGLGATDLLFLAAGLIRDGPFHPKQGADYG